jgi:hypothetical protein
MPPSDSTQRGGTPLAPDSHRTTPACSDERLVSPGGGQMTFHCNSAPIRHSGAHRCSSTVFGQNTDYLSMIPGLDEFIGIVDVALRHVDILHGLFHHFQLVGGKIYVTK